jgi:hypothetical protein
VRLAAHAGLAGLGRAESLLALGEGARGSCEERRLVLPALCAAMERRSRGRLLRDALASGCAELQQSVWALVVRYHADDQELLRQALAHPDRLLRVRAALTSLGLRRGATLAEIVSTP